MDRFVETLSNVLSPKLAAEWAAALLPQVLVAAVILFVGWVVWKLVERAGKRLKDRDTIDATAQTFLFTVARVAIFTVAGVMALGQVGVNTTSVLTSLGVVGLTIGFAAKDALSNVIAGLFIFWDRPFVIGDLVEIGGQYGRVSLITLRSTRVVTVDGKMLAIPNTTIVNTTVASYSNVPHLRLDVALTIGVEEDLGRARRLALSLVQNDAAYLKEPAPRFVVKAVNDYNLEVELQAWLDDEKNHVARRFELRELLFEAFRTAGVVMPYETLALAPVELAKAS